MKKDNWIFIRKLSHHPFFDPFRRGFKISDLESQPLFRNMFARNKNSQESFKKIRFLLRQELEEITPETVYKSGNLPARQIFREVLKEFILDKSRIVHPEYLKTLFDLCQQGHSCLLLPEHYGNFDMTNICFLTDQEPLLGEAFANSLVAVAGAKISRDDIVIATFARMYNRIVIYPSRGIETITDEQEREKERKRALPINFASIKEMRKMCKLGKMFLVFPSGTRIRPWDEKTKQGVPEVFNYLKMFEYICLMSVNGNNLPVNPHSQTMSDDLLKPDHIFLGLSPVIKTVDLIAEHSNTKPGDKDLKSHVVSQVMQQLFQLHNETETIRQQEISE